MPLKSVGALSLACWIACSTANAVDAIVVRPSNWSDAVATWKQYRTAQGLQILEVDSDGGQQEIVNSLAKHAQDPNFKYLLLAGDVNPNQPHDLPTFYRPSTALVQFGGDPTLATDNPYADLNGDSIPDLAVARIPADSAEQLRLALQRAIQYETNPDRSRWQRDVHVVAGVGGFGAVADSVIEMTTRRFLADRIPGWSRLSMTHASTASHYCPDPWKFSEACLARMNEGGMFWVYIGHGHVKTLDFVRVQEEYLPIMTTEHVPNVESQHPPIAVFLACYTGAFDAYEDALAEKLVMRENGPIAAIAASRVSGPYGLAMLSDGLLNGVYQQQSERLGDVILAAKQKMLTDTIGTPEADDANQSQMQMIGSIAAALSPANYDLRAERLEHVQQIHLLGDPLLRLHHPQEIRLTAPDRIAPGEMIAIRGHSLAAGELTVELAYRRGQVRRELKEIRGDLATQDGRELQQQRYRSANDQVLVSQSAACDVGEFQMQLTCPADLRRGRYCLRLIIQGQGKLQVGYREINVRPTPKTDAE